MNNDIAISVKNLTKIYHLYDNPQDRLKEALNPFKKSYHHDFYAMNDVSFEIKKGETVGIIGKNGAGKSTLLKMITGVLTPTSGSVEVNGKIASLLELGAGFNPEMSGLENIYLNGTLMGFTKEEMDTKVDAILEFADIGEFIYQPVKMYSSGMFARLAFSVSINVDPDILIVDEVLSVGDSRFQSKSIKRMEEIKNSGTTILFVSHAIGQIKRFCDNAIWIDKGLLKLIGEKTFVADKYEDNLYIKEEVLVEKKKEVSQDYQKRDFKILDYQLNSYEINTFDTLELEVKYEVNVPIIEDLLIGVAIFDNNKNYLFGPNTHLDKFDINNKQGQHTIKYELSNIKLLAGTYFMHIGFFTDKGIVNLEFISDAVSFSIENKYFTEGSIYLEHKWKQ